MKTTKMNLANMQGKLTRVEMKNIMAGSGVGCATCFDPSMGTMCGSNCYSNGWNCIICGPHGTVHCC